jgi:hypothetical protein
MNNKGKQNIFMINDRTGIIAQVHEHAGTQVKLASWLGLLV